MSRKKNFYEILDVAPTASHAEIRFAHLQKLQALRSQEAGLSAEDVVLQEKILHLAFDTLANPGERDAYDAKLSVLQEPVREQGSSLGLVSSDSDDLARRAAVLALRADALALKADAMMMRSGMAPYAYEETPPSLAAKVVSGISSPLRKLLIAVGVVAIVVMLARFSLVYYAVRKVDTAASVASKAEEQIILQEHFQKYGVRPANVTEARLLEAEYRRKENEASKAEYEQKMKEEESRRFLEDSKSLGDTVSANLRAEEERAKREEAYKKAQLEEEERAKKEAENERIRSQQEKWRAVLSR